jgi:hypothetical protein
MTEKTGVWTPTEIRRAAAIFQRDYTDHYGEDGPQGAQRAAFRKIASELNRSMDSVASRYVSMGPSFSAGPRRGTLSEQAFADKERRNAAYGQRSLTATVLGDPPPGYSALDKRRPGARP